MFVAAGAPGGQAVPGAPLIEPDLGQLPLASRPDGVQASNKPASRLRACNSATLQSIWKCRGDLSEEFALATFFPQPLQPPVETLAAACTRVTGLGDGGGQQHQAAWRAALVGGAALPGSIADTGDAARRRWALRGGGKLCLQRYRQPGLPAWLHSLSTALPCMRCRERGARALEERLGLKRAASAASTNAGAEAPSGGDAAPAAAPTKAATPTKLSPGKPADPDLEAGEAEAAADDSS